MRFYNAASRWVSYLAFITVIIGVILATVAAGRGTIDVLMWTGIGVAYGGLAIFLIVSIIECCTVVHGIQPPAAVYSQIPQHLQRSDHHPKRKWGRHPK